MHHHEYKKDITYTSFSLKANNGLFRELIVPVKIETASLLSDSSDFSKEIKAVWDTGATNSVIASRLAQELNLKPISYRQVTGVHGVKTVPVYMIKIILNNAMSFDNWNVTEGELPSGKIDFLLGMDIIALGDSSITQYKNRAGQLCSFFTFRYPSTQVPKDFVKDLNEFKEDTIRHLEAKKARKKFNRKH